MAIGVTPDPFFPHPNTKGKKAVWLSGSNAAGNGTKSSRSKRRPSTESFHNKVTSCFLYNSSMSFTLLPTPPSAAAAHEVSVKLEKCWNCSMQDGHAESLNITRARVIIIRNTLFLQAGWTLEFPKLSGKNRLAIKQNKEGRLQVCCVLTYIVLGIPA